MELFTNGKLNPQAFELDVRRATHDLADVLVAAAHTHSAAIESTHFLIAMAKVAGGMTQKGLAKRGLTVDQWESGLAECATKAAGALPPSQLSASSLDDNALEMLRAAEARSAREGLARLPEAILLLSGFQHATAAVRGLCKDADIDLEAWCEEIERALRPITAIPVFAQDGARPVVLESFTAGAKRVLNVLRNEAESLGYTVADPRHLLLALLTRESGVTRYGLYRQGLLPRSLQEAVMINIRMKARRTRSSLPLDYEHLQPVLRQILIQAGDLAARDQAERVSEAHLLRAFLAVESMAQNIMEGEKVNLNELRETAEKHEVPEDEDEEVAVADVETVRQRLRRRLVGQDEAIERILPYIQRMRFGFTTPERPVGVFLFCGQSGSGKTEMAREMARAVYGSEENLIFLEMGQFNAPESINIFVGAPPGYVGYGEGKLTNGLRDKPRAVVLFDEVEKAHAKVLDALMRFLDEGKIDDPGGPVRDGSQCIVILTSNLGAQQLSQLWTEVEHDPNWRTVIRKRLREEFRTNQFRVEFLNRVDELILFRTLKAADYAEIAARLLNRDLDRLRKERQIEVIADESVAREIGAYCAEIGEGARAAQRLTQAVVITPVIDFFFRNSCAPPVRLKASARRETLTSDCEPIGTIEFA